jgi:Putative S-adenosyl-L-methionine-dependent methyltransferase
VCTFLKILTKSFPHFFLVSLVPQLVLDFTTKELRKREEKNSFQIAVKNNRTVADSLWFFMCDITYILLEMDRILRPEGAVIFQDSVEVLIKIQSITNGMRWQIRLMDHESGPFNPEKILVAGKTYWTGQPKQQ